MLMRCLFGCWLMGLLGVCNTCPNAGRLRVIHINLFDVHIADLCMVMSTIQAQSRCDCSWHWFTGLHVPGHRPVPE